MKYLIGILLLSSFISCKKEKETLSNDQIVVEGIIDKPNFNKFFVSNLNAISLKPDLVCNPTTAGYIGDTISISEKGFYIGTYGDKKMFFYAEPGSKIRFKTDNKDFEGTLEMLEDFASSNEYLNLKDKQIQDSLLESVEDTYTLGEGQFLIKVDSLKDVINNLLEEDKPKDLKPIVYEFLKSKYELELYGLVKQYPVLKMQQGAVNYKAGAALEKRLKEQPKIEDSMVVYLPSYRDLLLSTKSEELEKNLSQNQAKIKAGTFTPTYSLLQVLESDSTLTSIQKDYMIGSFAAGFDYVSSNPILKELNDSLQKVVQSTSVKTQLNTLYKELTGLEKETKAPEFSGKDSANVVQKVSFDKPTLLYFYTTADPNLEENAADMMTLKQEKGEQLNLVAINFDKEKDWMFFQKSGNWNILDVHQDKRFHSQVAKDYFVQWAYLPRIVLVKAGGEIFNGYAPDLGTIELTEEIDKFLSSDSGEKQEK